MMTSSLNAALAEDEMTAAQLELKQIQTKWSEIRHMDRETAQKELDGEWLEAYNNFFQKYDEDMTKMEEIIKRLEKQIEPPRAQKKTKGQRRRDAYARKMENQKA
jgi:flagellar biosynthesis chaperone FliJ